MKIHGTAKGAALSTKDFGVAFGGAAANGGCSSFPDSLSTSANGVNVGAVIDTSDPKLGVGCVSFDGVNDRITLNGASAFSTTVGTISIWVNTPISQDRVFFAFADASANEYLTLRANGTEVQCTMRLASGGQQWEVDMGDLGTDEWHLVQLVQDGVAVKAYFDNVEETTFASSVDKSKWITANMDLGRIGTKKDSAFFQGLCDDIGLWNTAIDSDTRDAIWNSGDGAVISSLSSCSGIRAYYNCDKFDDTTVLTNNAVPIE